MSFSLSAQDIHFSQNHMMPGYINPALSGLFNGDFRFSGILRNQWNSVTIPYKTIAFGVDAKLSKQLINGLNSGAGLMVLSDKAGDSEYSTNGALLNLNASINPGGDSVHFFFFGLQPGIFQRSINFDKLQYDNQFDGDIYDPTLPNGEQFGMSDFSFFDFGAGLAWHYVINEKLNSTVGYSYQHMNEPKQSFFDNVSTTLPHKTSITAGANYFINDKIAVHPMFIYQQQDNFSQVLSGAQLSYVLKSAFNDQWIVSTGTMYRSKDAFSVINSLQHNNLKVGIAYDINISTLSQASNGKGAFEIGLMYIIHKVKPVDSPVKICPIY